MSSNSSSEESFEVPFDVSDHNESPSHNTDLHPTEKSAPPNLDVDARAEVDAARKAFDSNDLGDPENTLEDAFEDDPDAVLVAEPFVESWNQLITRTNWEKGRIISQWRRTLIESGADSLQYSDQAWVRRVGGVTAPHVGRLRRVHDRFGDDYEGFEGLYWTHFLAALDWDDAPLWLQGAAEEKWSVAAMRDKRWRETGAVESGRPTASEIIDVDLDEDVDLDKDVAADGSALGSSTAPAQGDGNRRTYNDDDPPPAGQRFDDPDFGEEEALVPSGNVSSDASGGSDQEPSGSGSPGPFVGLPELPDDMADAIESLKLSILRHKTAGYDTVDADTIQRYLMAMTELLK